MYCLRTYMRGTSMRTILSSYKQINKTTAQMDVSINGGTQKRMAKKGKSYENWWFRGIPILGNPPNSATTSKNVQNNVSSEGWSLSLLSLLSFLSSMPKAEKKVMLRRSLLVRVRAACGYRNWVYPKSEFFWVWNWGTHGIPSISIQYMAMLIFFWLIVIFFRYTINIHQYSSISINI